MTKQEKSEISGEKLRIYSGILFHNQDFAEGNQVPISYDFSCPEYQVLKEKYALEEIAGKGSDFIRARRLLHYLAPRLTHSSWYDNHVPCNALALLEYSLNHKEQGINCLNKSKILQECCLALGIYARRMYIMPYSPYDFDNHVVTEIYDRKLKKWIMLDPTTDGYFVDGNKSPLSLLEMREKFANDQFITYVRATDSLKDLKKLQTKYENENAYICKNLFYFMADLENRFGDSDHLLRFCPVNYSIKKNLIGNITYRLNHIPEELAQFTDQWKNELEYVEKSEERPLTDIEMLRVPPLDC